MKLKDIQWFNWIMSPIWLPLALIGYIIVRIAGICYNFWKGGWDES